MEKVDFVLVGAEGVVESGGIINKVFIISDNSYWKDFSLIIHLYIYKVWWAFCERLGI